MSGQIRHHLPAWLLILAFFSAASAVGQTGSVNEPVRYLGGVTIDPNVHEGRLRPPIGVHSHQTLRVNRTHPEQAEDHGWTYNHASNLAYWKRTFYQQYLSNPIDEHIAPGQTLITTSKDGMDWSRPVVVFPPYEPPPGTKMPSGFSGYMMHQRMGFYVAPNGRLLVLAFYGHAEDPFGAGGIGRVVREAYQDGTYAPIYFLRYSSHADWDESNTSYPFYKEDMWVSRIPVPIEDQVTGVVADDFESMPPGGRVESWNIYDPIWAPIRVVEESGNKYLQLEDHDPYDYARAVRVFEQATWVKLRFRIQVEQVGAGLLDIDVTDRYGNRAVRLRFDRDSQVKAVANGGYQGLHAYAPSTWYEFQLEIDAQPVGTYNLSMAGEQLLTGAELAVAVKSVERISFRTGSYRNLPNRKTDNERKIPPLPGADDPVQAAVFRVDDVHLARIPLHE